MRFGPGMTWLPSPCFPSSNFYFKKEFVNKFAFRGRIPIHLHREGVTTLQEANLGSPCIFSTFPLEICKLLGTGRLKTSPWTGRAHILCASCWSFQEFDRLCFYCKQLPSPDIFERRRGMLLAIVSWEKVRWRKKEKLSIYFVIIWHVQGLGIWTTALGLSGFVLFLWVKARSHVS